MLLRCDRALIDGTFRSCDIKIQGDRISRIDECQSIMPDDGEAVLDFRGKTVLPGLIDCHIHGFFGVDSMDGTPEALQTMSEALLRAGVTAFLPTTMTAKPESLMPALRCIGEMKGKTEGAKILGAFAEGPFITAEHRGAQPLEAIAEPDEELLFQMTEATHIEEIKLPNDETLTYGVGRIGKSAFDGCTSLKKIELGCLVNYLEAGCFRNCTSLKEIEFKADTVWGIERAAFEGCTSLENVIFNYSTVKEIGEYVFMGCTSLSKFDLSSVEKIGACAFYGTGLKELYIPTTVKYVGAKLFMGCIYEELTVYCGASNTPNEWASDWLYGAYKVVWNSQGQDDNNQSQNISFTYKVDGGNAIITGCHNGKDTIKIPQIIDGYNVTSIGEGAFKDNTEIVEVIIPSSVLSVGKTAFEGCVGIKKFSSESIYSKITA